MIRRRSLGFALILTIALVGVACQRQTTPPGGAKPEFKLGFMGDLTGANALLVVGSEKGSRLAVKEANAKGDLPVTLTLESLDTQADKDKAVPLAQKLAADDKVIGVVGPAFSGESFSSGPILQQAGIVQVTPSATNPGLAQQGWKAWFRAVGNDFSQGGPAPDVALKVIKGKKVYVGHDKTAYGEGLATIVRDGLRKSSPDALGGFEAVDPGKEDYSSMASNIATSGVDVFFWGGYSPEAGKILKQARDRGFKGTFLGADGSKDDTFLKGAGATAEGAYVLCPCADVGTSDDAVAKKFTADYKKEYGQDVTIYSGEGYDATSVLIGAIRKAGTPGSDIRAYRAKVAENVAKTSGFQGTTKTFAFQPNGELVDASVAIYLYQVKDGKYLLLGKTEDLLKK